MNQPFLTAFNKSANLRVVIAAVTIITATLKSYYRVILEHVFLSVLCFIMRPSSLGGGRILRRTLSVRPSVCLSACPSVCPSVRPVIVTERHVAPPSELQ